MLTENAKTDLNVFVGTFPDSFLFRFVSYYCFLVLFMNKLMDVYCFSPAG